MSEQEAQEIKESIPDELKPAQEKVFHTRENFLDGHLEDIKQEAIKAVLTRAGFAELPQDPDGAALEAVIKNLKEQSKEMNPLHFEAVRADAMRWLKKLGVSGRARWVDQATPQPKTTPPDSGDRLTLSEPEPWPDTVNGQELLKEITEVLPRFLVLPPHGAVAIALWIVHTYATKILTYSPLLKIHSPQMRCGKSTAVELIGHLVNKPIIASSMTPAALYRINERLQPTLLIDEADTIFQGNEALRRVVNSGHYKPTAYVYVCEGEGNEPTEFFTFGAKTLALIGELPATVADRSISIEMKRKKTTEKVEKVNPLTAREIFEPIRSKARRWVNDNLDDLRRNLLRDPLPGISDRANDHWCSLFTIADTVGSPWTARAHNAALSLSPPDEDIEGSVAGQLLGDLRDLFAEHRAEKLASEYMVRKLKVMEERPWPEYKNDKPITQTQIAKILKPFKIRPAMMRIDGYASGLRGYKKEQFTETWERYLPSDGPPFQPATAKQSNTGKALSSDATRNGKADGCTLESPANPPGQKKVAELHPEKGVQEKKKGIEGSV